MGKTNAMETGILQLIFNGTTISNLADNAASAPVTTFYVSLHTAEPGDGGDQTSSETTYTGYARVAVARTSSGWIVTGNSVSPAATISFPECSSGTATITHVGIGTAASGVGVLIYHGAVTPNILVSAGRTPSLTTASEVTED